MSIVSGRSSASRSKSPKMFDKFSTLNITIEDIARINASGDKSIDKFRSMFDETRQITTSMDPDKLKRHAKKNHAGLKNLKKDDFVHDQTKLKSSSTCLSLDASYAPSSISSTSSNDGVLSDWLFSWSLDSGNKLSVERNSLTSNVDTSSRPNIKNIKGGCFLRKDSSVVITEPQANRLRVFSRKRGRLLATVGGTEYMQTSFTHDWDDRKRFFPSGVCEIDTDNILAVTDRSNLYYIRIAGSDSSIEAEINLKGRLDLLGVAYTNRMKMILLDSGHTNKPFVGCYDTSGRIIREFKGNFSRPSYVTWNDFYQVAAIVDSGQRNISFYDLSAKHLTTFATNSKQDHLSDLFYPTGISWTSYSQLLVADKANNQIISFDFRNKKIETILDFSDGLKDPVVMACDPMSKTLLVTEEELLYGGKDTFRLKTFRRHGAPKPINEGLFF